MVCQHVKRPFQVCVCVCAHMCVCMCVCMYVYLRPAPLFGEGRGGGGGEGGGVHACVCVHVCVCVCVRERERERETIQDPIPYVLSENRLSILLPVVTLLLLLPLYICVQDLMVIYMCMSFVSISLYIV